MRHLLGLREMLNPLLEPATTPPSTLLAAVQDSKESLDRSDFQSLASAEWDAIAAMPAPAAAPNSVTARGDRRRLSGSDADAPDVGDSEMDHPTLIMKSALTLDADDLHPHLAATASADAPVTPNEAAIATPILTTPMPTAAVPEPASRQGMSPPVPPRHLSAAAVHIDTADDANENADAYEQDEADAEDDDDDEPLMEAFPSGNTRPSTATIAPPSEPGADSAMVSQNSTIRNFSSIESVTGLSHRSEFTSTLSLAEFTRDMQGELLLASTVRTRRRPPIAAMAHSMDGIDEGADGVALPSGVDYQSAIDLSSAVAHAHAAAASAAAVSAADATATTPSSAAASAISLHTPARPSLDIITHAVADIDRPNRSAHSTPFSASTAVLDAPPADDESDAFDHPSTPLTAPVTATLPRRASTLRIPPRSASADLLRHPSLTLFSPLLEDDAPATVTATATASAAASATASAVPATVAAVEESAPMSARSECSTVSLNMSAFSGSMPLLSGITAKRYRQPIPLPLTPVQRAAVESPALDVAPVSVNNADVTSPGGLPAALAAHRAASVNALSSPSTAAASSSSLRMETGPPRYLARNLTQSRPPSPSRMGPRAMPPSPLASPAAATVSPSSLRDESTGTGAALFRIKTVSQPMLSSAPSPRLETPPPTALPAGRAEGLIRALSSPLLDQPTTVGRLKDRMASATSTTFPSEFQLPVVPSLKLIDTAAAASSIDLMSILAPLSSNDPSPDVLMAISLPDSLSRRDTACAATPSAVMASAVMASAETAAALSHLDTVITDSQEIMDYAQRLGIPFLLSLVSVIGEGDAWDTTGSPALPAFSTKPRRGRPVRLVPGVFTQRDLQPYLESSAMWHAPSVQNAH